MRFLMAQIGNCRIWPDWKCNGLLLLVALARSGPEEALWWLLFKLLRYSFCGICRNKLEGLVLIAQGKKDPFFLTGQPSPPLLLSIYWRGGIQEGHLGCCSSLYDSLLLLQSGLYLGMCIATHKMDASPSSPSLGTIPGNYCYTLGGIRGKGQMKSKASVVRK